MARTTPSRIFALTLALALGGLLSCHTWSWAADPEDPSAAEVEPADPAVSPAEGVDGEEEEGEGGEEIDWAAIARPGEHHVHLEAFAGSWSFTMRIWNTPGSEPIEVEGRAEATLQLDGRFLDTLYRTELGGKAFVGHSIEGYDNLAEEYVRIWQDNLSTYTMIFKGDCQGVTPNVEPPDTDLPADGEPAAEEGAAAYTRTLASSFVDPISGQALRNQNVIAILDEDHYTLTSRIWSGTQSFVNMELEAERLPSP